MAVEFDASALCQTLQGDFLFDAVYLIVGDVGHSFSSYVGNFQKPVNTFRVKITLLQGTRI